MTKRRNYASDQAIGNRIKTRRVMLGLSQEKLADTLGVTFQQVQKYERGSNRVSGSTLAKVCETLKVSADVLLGIDGKADQMNPFTDLLGDPMAVRLLTEYGTLPKKSRRAILALTETLTSPE